MSRYTLFATLFLFLSACTPATDSTDKLMISVTILPQQYFLERLAGDKVEVNVMIPPGASPATYDPTISQLSRLDQSQVYMKMGYVGFELSWMEKIRAVNPDMKIVDLSQGVELVHSEEVKHQGHSHGGTDPHIWMSVLNARIIALNIYDELLIQMPDEKEFLKTRLAALMQELDSLHVSISDKLSEIDNRSFMIYHPALSYFARDYQLEQYPLEIEGKTPSPSYMRMMTDLGKEKEISVIFIQSQFDHTHAEVLAKELNARIIQFDPLDKEWSRQMFFVADQINTSL